MPLHEDEKDPLVQTMLYVLKSGGKTGPIFKKMIAKGTLENCHYTDYKVSLPPQTKQ